MNCEALTKENVELRAKLAAAERERNELRAKIAEHDDAAELVQEYVDATAAAMDETCGKNEKHCTCVPLLRFESKRLRAEAATYAKSVHRLQKAFDDQCNVSRQDAAEIEKLTKERDTLAAKCAEIRDALAGSDYQQLLDNIEMGLPVSESDASGFEKDAWKMCDLVRKIASAICRSKSNDYGKGWKSPEEYAALESKCAEMQGLIQGIECKCDTATLGGFTCPRCQALAHNYAADCGRDYVPRSQLDAVKSALKECVEALQNYGNHRAHCQLGYSDHKCNCGFNEALAKAKEVLK